MNQGHASAYKIVENALLMFLQISPARKGLISLPGVACTQQSQLRAICEIYTCYAVAVSMYYYENENQTYWQLP